MSKSIGRTNSLNEHAGAASAIAAGRLDPPTWCDAGYAAIESLGEWAYQVPEMRGLPGSAGSHAAMTGQCFARCPVPASIPSVVRMVCRGGVLQHPPFGGDRPVAMGDVQWSARSEVPDFLNAATVECLHARMRRAFWMRAGSRIGQACLQPCGAPPGHRHRCSSFRSEPDRTPYSCNSSPQLRYLSSSQGRAQAQSARAIRPWVSHWASLPDSARAAVV